ncbi:MAG: S8 family serine peptidase, partial [Cytophagales bacterium]|nr:S8 family serine peptidase [Cytophagales bacterium]
VQALPFVHRVQRVKPGVRPAGAGDLPTDPQFYAQQQMNAALFGDLDLTAKNVTIGLIDGGFHKANTNKFLAHIFGKNRVLGTKNFASKSSCDFYTCSNDSADIHGRSVWQMLAGADPVSKVHYGLAVDASFYLATTEVKSKEFRGEEDYWIAALEWMDSLGVRLVNSSLGYSKDFDDPGDDYHPSQMDGGTAAITKAAQIAAREKGMIIVVSAGNDGANKDWRVVSAPADAQGVIAVGATDDHWLKRNYSAVGPEFLDYVKPDVVCFSSGGTSMAAPVITGVLACLMQENKALTNGQAKELLQKSAHLYPYGNNFMGYGVPDIGTMINLLIKTAPGEKQKRAIKQPGPEATLASDGSAGQAVVFHKKDSRNVHSQEHISPRGEKWVIKRPAGVTHSTVVVSQAVTEITWE